MRLFLIVSLLLTLAAPVAAQEAAGPISTQTSQQVDADIATRLRDILAELGNYEDVTVTVNDGVVVFNGTTTSMQEVSDLDALAGRVEGVVAVRNNVTETTDVAARLNPAAERLYARGEQLVAMLPLVAVALVVFTVVLLLGLLLARARQPWDRLAPNAFIANIYRQMVVLVFGLGGLVIALDILNATALLSTILGAAGIIGLALGFAVRDTVENFIASIMLSIRQPFRPNDAIEINGDEGKVIRLTSRATILLSWDGNHIRIPNSTVFKSRIVNYTTNAERRILFEIGVSSDADLEAVRVLATETVAGLPFVLTTPEPSVWIDRIGDGAVFLTVTAWIDQRDTSLARAQGEALRQVKSAIEAAGVEVPDTTYRIQILGDTPPRKTLRRPAPRQTPGAGPVAEVDARSEHALDEIIEAERHDDSAEDLLREDSLKE